MGQLWNKTSDSSNENLETFSLIWLDASVDSEENRKAQDKLRATINQFKTYKKVEDCEEFIRKMSTDDDRIILIVSGQLGREIVPRIHVFEQILSIYIYCYDQNYNEHWSSQYSKVRYVAVHLDALIRHIEDDQEKRQHGRIYEVLPISIFDPQVTHEKLTTDLQGNLVHSQLLINCLLQMKADRGDRKELVAFAKQICRKNKAQLEIVEEFERDYSPQAAISWYTRDSFVSRLLNKALRKQNIDVLFIFQFFIVDIRQQLESLPQECTKAFRSQLISQYELEKLKHSRERFLSINSFFLATEDRGRAISFLQGPDTFEKVLFEIDTDVRSNTNKPFANIHSVSSTDEGEILFMLGSIFQVGQVSREKDGMWLVKLKLCSDTHTQLDSMNADSNQLLAFGHVLMTMGKIDEAEIYYQQLLKDWQASKHADLAQCYEALGDLADEKREYKPSLELYNKALEINLQNKEQHLPDIASNYNRMGEVYRKQRNYSEAMKLYEQALTILGDKPSRAGLQKQAACYNNIGIVHQDQERFREALDYYKKGFEIRKEYFPDDETSLGVSNNNMGNAYFLLDLHKDALYYYNEALKIYKKTLPPQHRNFASTYNNIAAIYDQKNKFDDALHFYNEAAKIYQSLYSPTHANVIKIQNNIERIKAKLQK